MSLLNQIMIVLLFNRKLNYSVLKDFAQQIHDGINGFPLYPTPVPDLLAVQTHIDDLQGFITAWGTPGNRGSHADLVNLQIAAEIVRDDLRGLAHYCMDTTPNDLASFAAVGWQTKSISSPIGALPGPGNLRVITNGVTVQGQIHYGWNKVKGANAYKVWVGSGNIITIPPDPSVGYVTVTKASFDDVAPSGSIRWIVVSCVGANPNTGYAGLAGSVTP